MPVHDVLSGFDFDAFIDLKYKGHPLALEARDRCRAGDETGALASVEQLLKDVQPHEALQGYRIGDDFEQLFEETPPMRYALEDIRDEAARAQHVIVVKRLIYFGLDVSLPAFNLALRSTEPTQLLSFYLEHGWNINAISFWSFPTWFGNIISADVDPSLVNWFLDNGGDPNCPAEYGLTPLSIAVEIARLGIVQKLFRHCASANTARYEGQLLHFAARRTDEFAIPVIRLVIDHCGREDINGLQWDGVWHQREYWHRIKGGLGTPLHEAAKVGRPDVVKLLLKDGADWNLLDSSNRTPVQTAEQEDNRLVADYLRRVMRDKKNESQGSKL